jgi:hypothetical protein
MVRNSWGETGALLVLVVASAFTASSLANESDPDDLRSCVAIESSSERLACYDQLAGRKPPAPRTAARKEPGDVEQPSAAPATEPPAVSARTLDDLADETRPKTVRDAEEAIEVRARVTSCEKDSRKKYYFVFDNGQVWKQSSDKKLRYRECDFEVTISKDFFGYKMQPDGSKSRIRIVRVK